MPAPLPLVFLAFANDMDDHLATLKDESRALYESLRDLEQARAIAVHREESTQFDELYNDLLAFDGQLVIFHYAGHANGTMLQLEGGNGGASGIAKLLGQQASLKLVFLNGCATKDQVKLLHDAGVPAVIATSVDINDKKATMLSTAFYGALAGGRSIVESFESACAYLEGKFDGATGVNFAVNRSPSFDFDVHEQQQQAPAEFEWTLYIQADCEADLAQWRLTHAQKEWMLALKDSKGLIRDYQDQAIELAYLQRQRTCDVIRCANCGHDSSLESASGQGDNAKLEDANVATNSICPICGSDNTQRHQLQSFVPDAKLAFTFDETRAREIAFAAAGISPQDNASLNGVSLHKIYLPFWVFSLGSRTEVSGERGQIKDIHADTLEIEWQSVTEEIEHTIDEGMLPAFNSTNYAQAYTNFDGHADAAGGHWYWDLQKAELISQLDNGAPFIPFTQNAQTAFSKLAGELEASLSEEASSIIGGSQQKNLTLQTRYDELKLSSIFLPHWCVLLENKQEQQASAPSSIIINGQTGAVRFSPSVDKPSLFLQSNLQRTTTMNPKSSLNRAETLKQSLWISVFSGAGIGIMVGLLMGLAAPQDEGAKSIVAIFIGAVGVGLAALLGLNDKHFSAAKGLRIGSFGLAVALAAMSGIYVRDNHILSPSVSEKATELKSVFEGISNEALIELLRETKNVTQEDGTLVTINKAIGSSSALFSSGVNRNTCQNLNDPNLREFSPERLLKRFRQEDENAKLGWKNLADSVEKKMPDSPENQKAMLLLARDAACLGIFGSYDVKPNSPECAVINNASDSTALQNAFKTEAKLIPIYTLAQTELTGPKYVETALDILKPVLCSQSTQLQE